MADIAPRAELLRSLGQLVRGLSALFWGLPLCLIVAVRTASADLPRIPTTAAGSTIAAMVFSIVPVFLATGLLVYALTQMGRFQKQERIWKHALERARLLAVANVGLSPFLFFWNRAPQEPFYAVGFALTALCAVLFLFNLNQALSRLAAMLPDETLRSETRAFSTMNLWLLCGLLGGIGLYVALRELPALPWGLVMVQRLLERFRFEFIVIFGLLPLAMTMTLVWKAKEAVFASIFGEEWPHTV
ncbi:MAG TPA: hypothetical protein VEH27_19080 [Methylomirabilota bacterium]|nr:hypothetical protein [Methylomirabilota bacterium]